MKYTYNDVPLNTPIWACAYSTNNNTMYNYLIKKPVLGIVVNKDNNEVYRRMLCFYESKKDGDIKKSSKVYCTSREYADTYEECVELYNSLVDREIKRAEEVIKEHERQKIIIEGDK